MMTPRLPRRSASHGSGTGRYGADVINGRLARVVNALRDVRPGRYAPRPKTRSSSTGPALRSFKVLSERHRERRSRSWDVAGVELIAAEVDDGVHLCGVGGERHDAGQWCV